MIFLTHPTANAGAPLTLTLPRELLWVDQYGWQQVVQQKDYTTTGALLIDTWRKQAGQPMTLRGEQDRAWCERGQLETLRAWAGQAGVTLAMLYRGASLSVVFDNENSPIEAEPLADVLTGGRSLYEVRDDTTGAVLSEVTLDYFDPQPTDPFIVTLRFLIL